MICAQCRRENEAGARFCAFCGAELPVQAAGTYTYCAECGAANPEGSGFCGECGTALAPEGRDRMSASGDVVAVSGQRTSWAWWLLPVFFAWVGGLIGWAVVREVDRGKAKGLLILGIVMTAFWPLLWLVTVLIVGLLTYPAY